MELTVPFSKYSGSGNDFVIINNQDGAYRAYQNPEIVRTLCNRHDGIGADGILFLERSAADSYVMRIFQPDGLEVEMCGNALRCLAHYIHSEFAQPNPFDIKTIAAIISVCVMGNEVAIAMKPAKDEKFGQILEIDNQTIEIHTLNTGVPHTIIFVDDLEQEHLMPLAKKVRYNAAYTPQGTNVNFVKITSPTSLAIRTYERGVEGETQACGTGAAAAAIVAAKLHGIQCPITVIPRSNSPITITFPAFNEPQTYITAQGPAYNTFTGRYLLQRS